MKTNFKKLVVMLGIVLGFTLSAGAIIMGWGYIAESEMHSFQENCSAIPNAYVKTDGKEYVVRWSVKLLWSLCLSGGLYL